eukprot:CAMPEP_0168184736 /NCGR_PEP_ID=MMETSP0139_2-20121125/13408_1 /TAXON_ID=44445 /ORGANISM="Pseudo-nitzschia australis, Strain 10249 10 AB" /LENGTH=449 /DNA_ID=CAMNT_0008106397 /DNA_START=179 /DNA_END=1528 /DNA_ORIENTATION=+
MTVEYDYKLEANASSVDFGENSTTNAVARNPLDEALFQIDSNMIASIQAALPTGRSITEDTSIPDIEFDTVNSRFVNICFTESDGCQWVKSRVHLSFTGERPKNAIERLALDLVQDYLQEVHDVNPVISTRYVYPMMHSSFVQFQIAPVAGSMNDTQIGYFKDNFYEVFQALVSAIDGDTEVTEAYFVSQDIIEELPGQEEEDETATTAAPASSSKLLVDMKYYGKCRYCVEDEFVGVVDGLITENLDLFLGYLQRNGNSNPYFQQAKDISFSKPVPAAELPPTNGLVSDANARKVSRKIPWGLWLGIAIAIAMLSCGILSVQRDQQKLDKEEDSTGDESSVYQERNHVDDNDSDVFVNLETYTNEDIDTNNNNDRSININNGNGNKNYDFHLDDDNDIEIDNDDYDDDDILADIDVECEGSLAENSIISKNETTDSNGAHSNYEVYVY